MKQFDGNQQQFIASALRKGVAKALIEQKANARKKPSKAYRGESLKEALDNIRYTIDAGSDAVTASAGIPLTVRFNDMKHLGRMRVYNKPLWGTMYNDTLQEIKYGYREYLRWNFGNSLNLQNK